MLTLKMQDFDVQASLVTEFYKSFVEALDPSNLAYSRWLYQWRCEIGRRQQ